MISSFSVTNYRSIKETQTLSFIVNKKMKNDADEHLLIHVNDHVDLLKLGVLYGYNASGKTNMILAFDTLRDLVLDGPETKDEETLYEPFALDDAMAQKPSTFSLVFYIGGINYQYDISVQENTIPSEQLSYRPEGRKTLVFSRTFDVVEKVAKLTVGKVCGLSAKEKTILSGNTLGNGSVLFAYQKTNIHSPVLEGVVTFFKEMFLPCIEPDTSLLNWSINTLAKDASKKDFYVQLLKKADFQVSDLQIKEAQHNVSDQMLSMFEAQGAPKEVLEQLKKEKKIKTKELFLQHALENGTTKPFPIELESAGTRRYFGLSGVLNLLVNTHSFVAIDELETSLHPELISFFLRVFLLNAAQSQLLVATHEQSLMDKDYMRNDMVWFCEKEDDGASVYYPAEDFNLHKHVSLMNFYQSGKLGAVPHLGSPFLQNKKEQ
ncbi:MAG: ATP-binding protein [Sphaerochaeta sp.]|jgi:AAA15 family ATPase/GTPase|nr:ATP-binding protein [Sphaerochaeta sp.]MCH3919926.1 ATP-binding protein [Sphaerochaeta sp.]